MIMIMDKNEEGKIKGQPMIEIYAKKEIIDTHIYLDKERKILLKRRQLLGELCKVSTWGESAWMWRNELLLLQRKSHHRKQSKIQWI